MNAPRTLAQVALLSAAALTLGGCSYTLLEGNGLYSHGQVAEGFRTAFQSEMQEWENTARSADPTGTSRGVARVHRSGSTLGWLWIDRRVEYHDAISGFNDHVLVGRTPGLAGIVYGESDVALYDVLSREQFASHSTRHALFGSLYWGEVVKPGETSFPLPWNMPPLRHDPPGYTYTRTNGASLLWGVLAGGTKNGRAYGQILWIPIPLWSTGEQPDQDFPADVTSLYTPDE